MKTFTTLFLLCAALLQANPRFEITKSTIDAGGANTPGPRFTLTGTVGQPDAAPRFVSADNRFAVQPGFWPSATVVPAPGAPELTMRPGAARDTAILAWPVTANGYILEESTNLAPGSWSTVRFSVVDTATEHTVTYP